MGRVVRYRGDWFYGDAKEPHFFPAIDVGAELNRLGGLRKFELQPQWTAAAGANGHRRYAPTRQRYIHAPQVRVSDRALPTSHIE